MVAVVSAAVVALTGPAAATPAVPDALGSVVPAARAEVIPPATFVLEAHDRPLRLTDTGVHMWVQNDHVQNPGYPMDAPDRWMVRRSVRTSSDGVVRVGPVVPVPGTGSTHADVGRRGLVASNPIEVDTGIETLVLQLPDGEVRVREELQGTTVAVTDDWVLSTALDGYHAYDVRNDRYLTFDAGCGPDYPTSVHGDQVLYSCITGLDPDPEPFQPIPTSLRVSTMRSDGTLTDTVDLRPSMPGEALRLQSFDLSEDLITWVEPDDDPAPGGLSVHWVPRDDPTAVPSTRTFPGRYTCGYYSVKIDGTRIGLCHEPEGPPFTHGQITVFDTLRPGVDVLSEPVSLTLGRGLWDMHGGLLVHGLVNSVTLVDIDGGTVAPPARFGDIDPTVPFAEEIQWLAGRGVTTGYEDGTFRPGVPVSRQAFAAYLYRYEHGTDAPACTRAPFPDVPADAPFCGAITWLAGTGVTTGYDDGLFRPTAAISRQAMAAQLQRYRGLSASASSHCSVGRFPDVDASNPFCSAITWLADTGLTTGYADGRFAPAAAVTRQAMAAYLFRYDAQVAVQTGP